jgi:2-dehydro-3-deoxyphosphogalactonate aldolase
MSFISNVSNFKRAFEAMPLIGILRGVRPDEVTEIAEAAVEGGIRIVEIPLNSPDPLTSLERAAKAVSARAIVGAGTVLLQEEVDRVAAMGGQLIVSPNFNEQVVRKSKSLGLASVPGVMTPSEAFAALAAGGDALKLFPGEILSLPFLNALAQVLPKHTPMVLVGGIKPEDIAAFAGSSVGGFGIGSSLYKPGMRAAAVMERAKTLADAMRRAGFAKA